MEKGNANDVKVDVESAEYPTKRNVFQRMYDSFKPPEEYEFDTTGMNRGQIAITTMAHRAHRMTGPELFVMSFCTCVGTGLFIGTGNSLKTAGPAGLLVSVLFPSVGIVMVMFCVGEMACRYQSTMPYYEFPARFLDQSWGWACGVIYAATWMVTAPLEMIAGAMLTQYWNHHRPSDNAGAKVNPVAWIALIYSFSVFIQISGTRPFALLELIGGTIKLIAMAGFIIYGIVIVCGGGPHQGYIGGSNWSHPDPAPQAPYGHGFANGVKGTVTAMMSWTFAFGGTEVPAVAAAEAVNPARAIPSIGKRTIWRVSLFFILSSTLAAMIVPCGLSALGSSSDGSGSIYVLAFSTQEIPGLDSVFNAVIMISVISIANSALYSSPRVFLALASAASEGQVPRFFVPIVNYLTYVDRKGRPLGGLSICLTFALLSFVVADTQDYSVVFDWLYALVQLGFMFVYLSICAAYINMRWSMKIHNVPLSDLTFTSFMGVPGAIIGVVIWAGMLFLQFWVYIWPVGYGEMAPRGRADTYFKNDLSVIIVIILFVGHKVWSRSGLITPKTINPREGVRVVDWDELEKEQEWEAEQEHTHRLRYYGGKLI